ncbi:uncharacterized protein LOC110182616 [Drosophila serrata]|uniref:uncharacterized protein LOC110182616 n=1 Tax=Drosophila serrata TaxID=7274 RepID=UPI000A1D159D|nr:uncharacterized protein LOC110182616 [Drosophila serrata]
MQSILRLLLICGLIYLTIAQSGFQNIYIGGFGGGDEGRSFSGGDGGDRSSSVHNSDVDNLLKRLESLDNSGNDRNNWGNNAARSSGFDADRSQDDSAERIIQFIQG